MEMAELKPQEMEKVSGGKFDFSGENRSMMHKCKYDLGWTKEQYLEWCRCQGATEAEIASAAAVWNSI